MSIAIWSPLKLLQMSRGGHVLLANLEASVLSQVLTDLVYACQGRLGKEVQGRSGSSLSCSS